MARRRKMAGIDTFADLAKKAEILEREMARQRAAIDRLKTLATDQRASDIVPARPTLETR